MTFLDELDDFDKAEPVAQQDEFDFGSAEPPPPPTDWTSNWALVPPNVKPEFHARVRAHYEPKNTSPSEAYAVLLKKQGGKLTEAQAISIGGSLDPFAALTAPATAPKTNGKVNPPKKRAKEAAAAEEAAAEAAATEAKAAAARASAPQLTAEQLVVRNTIVATRCVPAMQDNDIDALIEFATKVAARLGDNDGSI